ncbi:Na(+)/H(+) exchange regulatory cofactor NHE-RF1 [Bradysia coprophila]|uniref:Na(+)/H(+) exchange regulatory cofactor NHE-RF1 n=1 Tax=Bradysia coprophila TaxID=38358 RepID=UPI00187DA16C|nr:Na(+)/H(+) exchange regulatory cofactor NHE-RF1 [Bradysia coprophila]
MSKTENGIVHTSRLCHVIKVDDFDGYGFNLHAEKGKQGQYIGKVDDGSPAERSGLKQGDRIIEVNGVNIGNETHKQVVQRIKAIASEVQLLVVDPAVPVNKDNRIIEQTNGSSTTVGIDTPDNVNSKIKTSPPSSPTKITESKPSPDIVIQTVSTPSSPKDPKDDHSVTSGNNSSTSSPPVSIETTETRSMPSASSVQSTPEPTPPVKQSDQNGSATKSSHGLNLNMTAAELRAKLAAKKKFDPKNDSVDLRKKFEIVQKL